MAVDVETDNPQETKVIGIYNSNEVTYNFPGYLNEGVLKNDNDNEAWLQNKANAKIIHCQATKHEFRRWMKRRSFAKSKQDEDIAKRCGDGQ